MTGNVACTVYVAPARYDNNIIWEYTIFIIVMQLAVILVILKSNLDERVSDRVLYDILIQAGRIVDLYIPRDKETNRPKGYAFAEYETEEIADYAVRLFSGLVSLYKRPLKFAVSGQEKAPSNLPTATMSRSNSSFKVGPPPVPFNNVEVSSHSARLSAPCSFPENQVDNGQVLPHQSSGYRSHLEGYNYDYSRRVFGATMDSISRTRLSRFDTSAPISYPFY